MSVTVIASPSSTLLTEGSTVSVSLSFGGGSSGDMADFTYIFFTSTTAKIGVSAVVRGSGAPAIVESVNITNPLGGSYDYRVKLNGRPTGSSTWALVFTLAGKAGAYGIEPTVFQVQFIDAATGFSVNLGNANQAFNLVNSAGQGELPYAIAGVSATPSGSKSVTLRWTAPSNATTTNIERSLTSGSGFLLVANIGGNGALIYEDGPLTASTLYYYRLRSQNEAGYGPYCPEFSAKTLAAPTAPDAVTNTAATGISSSSIQATWVPSSLRNSGVTTYPNTYSLLRYNSSGGVLAATISGPAGATISSLTATGLAANTTYYFKVRVTNETGSTDSAEFSGRSLEVPGTPAAPTALAGTVSDFTKITLTWTDNATNELGFRISRSTAAAGPFTQIAVVGANITSWLDPTQLATSTTYYYQIYAYNNVNGGLNSTNAVSAGITTLAAPATPGAPAGLTATAVDDQTIELNWSLTAPLTELSLYVKRGVVSGGPYTQIAEVPSGTTRYVNTGLTPSATYYYVIVAHGYSADSAASAQASATTFARTVTVAPQCPFSLDPNSRNMIGQISGRTIVTSDLDRWIINDNNNWYKAGLKRQLTAPVLTATAGGSLEAGSYVVYVVLLRNKKTRSLPCPVSNTLITTAGQKIRIAPELSADTLKAKCRDIGYNISGTQIDGCDEWEIYVGELNTAGGPKLVATLPLACASWEDSAGSKKYTIDGTLTKYDLFTTPRRPMELNGESSLPPSAWRIDVGKNRIRAFGESTLIPPSGASLAISAGAKQFTVSGWTLPEASIGHVLWLNNIPTKWEVYDTEGSTAYIQNPDPKINATGFEGAGGSFTTFRLVANQSRVYYSAYFEGEANRGITFSPETFPPFSQFETEFFPDDNTDPNGMISVQDDLLVGKPSKWMLVRGGEELGFPLIQVSALSRGSGLNAPNTLTRDSSDVAYYVGDAGPHRVSGAGVEKVNIYAGNAHLFQEVFDIASVANSRGCWFNREDWFVVVGLNRIGQTGRKAGFVLDVKNSALLPFSHDFEVTAIKEVKNSSGEYQLMYGDRFGNVGVLFKRGSSVDGVNFTLPLPQAAARPKKGYVRSGLLDTDHALCVISAQTRMRTSVSGVDIACAVTVGGKDRNDSVRDFVPKKTRRFSTLRSPDRLNFPTHRVQNAVVQLDFEIPINLGDVRLSWQDLSLEVMTRGASA